MKTPVCACTRLPCANSQRTRLPPGSKLSNCGSCTVTLNAGPVTSTLVAHTTTPISSVCTREPSTRPLMLWLGRCVLLHNCKALCTRAGIIECKTRGQFGDKRSGHLSHISSLKNGSTGGTPFKVRDRVSVHITEHSPQFKKWLSVSHLKGTS